MNFYHLRGILAPLRFDLRGGLNTVGRNPTNDVVIHEASVSAFHAELNVEENGVFVRDLQSTNGTFIDDEPITLHEIRSGQVVQFGTVALRLLTDEIRISVPKLPTHAPEPQVRPLTPPPCASNPAVPATHQCAQCGRTFHYSALRVVQVGPGTQVAAYCPSCSGQVKLLPPSSVPPPKAPGILARVTQTLRLGTRKHR